MIIIGLFAIIATFLGGLFALRFRDKLHLILGFSAGAIIGVAFFDLLPEAIKLGSERYDIEIITGFIGLGFLLYTILDRLLFLHHHDEHCENKYHRGKLGAASLAIHSFLDGMAIGLAWQVSSAVGVIVAVAVLTHDFSDGINTVGMILKNGGTRQQAFRWLAIDAVSPFIGIISTLFFSLPSSVLGLVLALFGGFFLYIGASDLLPESHHAHPKRFTTIMTLIGIGLMYVVIKIAE